MLEILLLYSMIKKMKNVFTRARKEQQIIQPSHVVPFHGEKKKSR